jgi:hypothetical protein
MADDYLVSIYSLIRYLKTMTEEVEVMMQNHANESRVVVKHEEDKTEVPITVIKDNVPVISVINKQEDNVPVISVINKQEDDEKSKPPSFAGDNTNRRHPSPIIPTLKGKKNNNKNNTKGNNSKDEKKNSSARKSIIKLLPQSDASNSIFLQAALGVGGKQRVRKQTPVYGENESDEIFFPLSKSQLVNQKKKKEKAVSVANTINNNKKQVSKSSKHNSLDDDDNVVYEEVNATKKEVIFEEDFFKKKREKEETLVII